MRKENALNVVVLFLTTYFLIACNSETGGVVVDNSYSSLEDLVSSVPCNAEKYGSTKAVGIENVIYICTGDFSIGVFEWVVYQEEGKYPNMSLEEQGEQNDENKIERELIYESVDSLSEQSPINEWKLSSSEMEKVSSSSFQSGCKSTISNNILTDARDGRQYGVVTIGTQTWMMQNLSYIAEGSFCIEPLDSCAKYGRLYTWATAIDSVKFASDFNNPLDCGYGKLCKFSGKIQGVCPCGWHLPSEAEWEKLIAVAGGQTIAGRTLKAQSGWETGYGSDEYGFAALPSGMRDVDGYFLFVGHEAHFWSASTDFAYTATKLMLYNHGMIGIDDSDMRYAYSVRCLKD